MSKLDEFKATVLAMKAEGKSNREIGAFYGTSEKSVRRALKRWLKEDGVNLSLNGDEAVIETPSIQKAMDPVELMAEVGLKPEDWIQDSVAASKWGRPGDPQFSLKLGLKRAQPSKLILPAVPADGRLPTFKASKARSDGRSWVYVSDFHSPFHDPVLLRHFIDHVAQEQPELIVIGGDLVDFPAESRHRHKPEWEASAQDCISSAYNFVLVPIRLAAPNAEIVFLPGNHDERIRNAVIDQLQGLYDLRPASSSLEPTPLSVWDLRNLFRLEELGISYIDPEGTYEYAMYPISDKLGATHGWLAKNKSAQSAEGHLEALGHSVVHGHTHRMGAFFKTLFEMDGQPRELVGIEAGCMCLHRKGLGYARSANWQQGWVTGTVFENGMFTWDFAKHVNGKTLWHGKMYE